MNKSVKLYSPAFVALLFVFLVGTAGNVHNSGDPVDSFGEAKTRVVAAVKEGYSRDHFVGYKLND